MRNLLVFGVLGSACGNPDAASTDAGSQGGHATGVAQKGPFISGSSVQVFPLDAELVPVGTVFSSQIADDLGSFDIAFPITEPFVEVVVNGFFYDELTAGLSAAPLTLRAYAPWEQAGSLRVNLLTTIAEPRIKLLVQQGAPYVDALAQATNELFAAFAIDGSAVGDLVTLDLTGANDGAAALIGVSLVLLEYASEQAAAPGERVAELALAISQIATALKTTGGLPTALTKSLAKAAHDLDIRTIESNLIGIFLKLGTHLVLPDIHPYVDPLAALYPWARALSSPTGGDDLAACAIGTKIYFAGACGASTQLLEYDTISDLTTARSPMPTARAYATCGVVDGKLYVLGGLSNCNASNSALANLEVYDPTTDSWTQRAPSAQPQLRRPVASVNGELYLVGSSGDLNQVATNSLDRYDPGSNTWSSMPAMSTGRVLPAVCAAGTNIYVFGGFARSTTTITPLASVEVFDTVANSWSSRASMHSPRAWSGCGEINGQLYVVGGQAQSSVLLGGNDKYDPVTDTWLSQTPMDDPNYVSAATVANGAMFVFDGARIDRYEPVKE